MRRRAAGWPVGGRCLGVLLLVLVGALGLGLLPGTGSFTRPAAAAGNGGGGGGADGTGRDAPATVLLLGAPGLRWSDLSPGGTPALWSLATRSSPASLSVRTVSATTCPVDGWLMVSAGRRAQAPPLPSDGSTVGPGCPDLAAPVPDGSAGAPVIDGWQALVAHNDGLTYDARLGTLGGALSRAGVAAQAVGHGAAYAIADEDGRVATYFPEGAAVTPQLLAGAALTVVDLGAVEEQDFAGSLVVPLPRQEQVAALDARLAGVLQGVPGGVTVLLAAPAGSGPAPALTVAMASGPSAGPAPYGADAWLDSRSTRRTGLVQATDITPTLLTLLGVDRPGQAVIGSPWAAGAPRPGIAEAVDQLVDLNTAAQTVDALLEGFFAVLIVSQLLLYSIAWLALRRAWTSQRRLLGSVRRTALIFAAVPVSSYLANIVPWWRTDRPAAVLTAVLLGWVLAVTALAQVGPWRRRFLGPFGVIAGGTALVLAAEVLTGSNLQLSGLIGYSPLVAGRFYGFGNLTFALFATGAVLGTAVLVEPLVRAGRRGATAAVVGGIGVVAVVVNGWPAFGSDFGGVIALVPGFAVLVLLLTGLRVTPWRAVVIAVGAATAIAVIATLDWLQPPAQRSHLGRFVQQVLDGEALIVVQRKLEANLRIFEINPLLSALVPAALVFIVLVLMRGSALRAAALDLAYAESPVLRPALRATLVMLVVGFAVNDSGIAIPAVALTLAVPLMLAAGVRALERAEAVRRPQVHHRDRESPAFTGNEA